MSDTKQINVRLPIELHKALDDHKVRTGEDKSDIIRRGIESVLGSPNSYRATDVVTQKLAEPPKQPQGETVELAAWLSGRTGMPRAIMRRRISEGRVKVAGEVFREDRCEKDRLTEVSLDGNPVKPG